MYFCFDYNRIKLNNNQLTFYTMKLKTYETPEVELLRFTLETNFCLSGTADGLDNFDLLNPDDIIWLF